MNTSKVTIVLLPIILFGLSANIFCQGTTKASRNRLGQLKAKVKDISEDIKTLKKEIAQINTINNKIAELDKIVVDYLIPMDKKMINNVGIAFQACANGQQKYNEGDRLQFASDSYNIGGHYDASVNEYTCPYTGLYKFSINLLSEMGKNCSAGIKTDRWNEVRAVAWVSGISGKQIQASNSITFVCKIGQRVWVEGVQNENVVAGGRCASSFSGKLYAFDDALDGRAGVAFQSCATASQSFKAGNRLKFPLAAYNVDENYKTSDNTFTCPYDGVYELSMTLLSGSEQETIARFKKAEGDKSLGEVIVVIGNNKIQASNTIIFECKANEKVWVEGGPDAGSNNRIFGSKKGPYHCISSFSGKLLQFPNGYKMPNGNVKTIGKSNSDIAFTACVENSHEIKQGEKLTFKIQINKGDGYTHNTKEFICPVTGLYEFSITLVSEINTELSAGIKYEEWDQPQGVVRVSREMGRHVQASNSYMFICKKDHKVWVEGVQGDSSDQVVFADNQNKPCLSTFSGKILAVSAN